MATEDTNTPLYLAFDESVRLVSSEISTGDEVGIGRVVNRFDFVRFDAVLSIDHMFENEISEFPLENGSNISDHVIKKQDKLSFVAVITNSPFLQSKAVNNASDFFVENFGQIRASGPLGVGSVDLSNYYNPNNAENFTPLPLNYPRSPVGNDFSSISGARKTVARRTVNLNAQGAIDTVLGAVGLGPNLEPQPSAYGDPGYGARQLEQPNTTGSVIPVLKDRANQIFKILKEARDFANSFSVITKNNIYNNMVITKLGVPITNSTGDALEFTIDCREIRRVGIQRETIGVTADPLSSDVKSVGSKQPKSNTGQPPQDSKTKEETGQESAEVQAAKIRNTQQGVRTNQAIDEAVQ